MKCLLHFDNTRRFFLIQGNISDRSLPRATDTALARPYGHVFEASGGQATWGWGVYSVGAQFVVRVVVVHPVNTGRATTTQAGVIGKMINVLLNDVTRVLAMLEIVIDREHREFGGDHGVIIH
jgi:hypothetical protein